MTCGAAIGSRQTLTLIAARTECIEERFVADTVEMQLVSGVSNIFVIRIRDFLVRRLAIVVPVTGLAEDTIATPS